MVEEFLNGGGEPTPRSKPAILTSVVDLSEVALRTLADLGVRNPKAEKTIRSSGANSQIIRALRGYPPKLQEECLKRVFGPEGARLPNGEQLGVFLAELNNIRWFRPQSPPDKQLLEIMVNKHLHALPETPSIQTPIRLIRNWSTANNIAAGPLLNKCADTDPWDAAKDDGVREAAVHVARHAAGAVARDVVKGSLLNRNKIARWFTPPWDTAWEDIAETAGWAAAKDAAGAAIRIVVQDLMLKKGYKQDNPFEPLMEIWRQGFWPIGKAFNPKTEKAEFVIFVPPIQRAA